MNFTSQICTTKEQSERLLALGLKAETADCFLEYVGRDNYGNNVWHPSIIVNNYRMPDYSKDFPAWSLSRLLEMLPSFIDIGGFAYMLRIIQGKLFSYRSDIAGHALLYGKANVYASAIYTIKWLIEERHFNKEYLTEK